MIRRQQLNASVDLKALLPFWYRNVQHAKYTASKIYGKRNTQQAKYVASHPTLLAADGVTAGGIVRGMTAVFQVPVGKCCA